HGTSPIRCTSALTRSSRPAGLVALILLAVYPSIRLSAQTIDTIVVVNHNIFDLQGDDAPGPLARLANRLHVTTRAGVVRRTLLAAEYASKSDGKHGVWFMGVPFFETRAARALAIDGEAASERVLVFRDGVADTVERRVLRIGVTAGFAPHATSRDFVRVWASAQWRRED